MTTETPINSVEKDLEKLSLKDESKPEASSDKTGDSKPAESSKEGSEENRMNSSSLYVTDLDPSVSEAVLFEVFSPIGDVASIRVCRDTVTRESLGYAYVNFHNANDAQKARDELNYATIKGRSCRIMWSQRDPSVRRSNQGNTFIKNLDPSIDNKALHDTFSAFGEILSCKVATDREGNSLGYGFIQYAYPESAEEAIRLVNGMVLNGRPVFVGRHIPRNERESQAESQKTKFTNVYVKNLDPEIADEKALTDMFGKYGEITSAYLATDADRKSKGFGFVNFADHTAAQKAVDELNDREGTEGRKLYVGRAQNKFERQTELRKKYEADRLEKLTKYQGVNLYIKNLEDTITDEALKEAFAPFGTITSAKVMTDDQGKSRGFGFVCYSAPEEANRAISEMNQHLLGNKPLYVAFAQRKDLRQSQMRQQLNARNQLRMQQQVAGGIPGQFIGGPIVYGQPGFINAPGPRGPYNPQMMMRGGMAPMGQWQAGPGGPQQGGRGSGPYGYPSGGPSSQRAQAAPESLADAVKAAPENVKKQIIGEALYPKILAQEKINKDNDLAGKVTGMLLDMDNDDLIELAENDASLKEHVEEALSAYQAFLENNGESQ